MEVALELAATGSTVAAARVDMLVVGAGISGIYAAKFYLDIHPNCELVILDRDTCVGGTWNARRSYESFWTQWTVGTAEFPDLPMAVPPSEDVYFNFFKAKHTTRYLESYVDHHSWAGKSLRDRMILSSEVQSITQTSDGWLVSSRCRASGQHSKFHSSKLAVASGLTSTPLMPSLKNSEASPFNGPLIHQENFGSSDILSSPEIMNLTVLGGGKSSADMVYSAAKAGKTVNWVLKSTESTGPGFFLSPRGEGTYKSAFELGMTRIAATFTPSLFNPVNLWTSFLHSSRLGVKMMQAFWQAVDKDTLSDADFDGRESLQGFRLLKPHSPIFWQNATGGLLNHDDFFDTIALNVRIYCSDVDHIADSIVKLQSGESIPTDAILCGTGWVPSLQFFSETLTKRLGLPFPLDRESPEDCKLWNRLETEADQEVVTKFPQLADPPPHFHPRVTTTPCRLYRHMVPLPEKEGSANDRSIVFLGHLDVGSYFPTALCQAMWATAYLDGKLTLPEVERQREAVATFRAWCRRRYLSRGDVWNNMTFELLGYTDSLLKDLGLGSHLGGWFGHWVSPSKAADFGGLLEEYVEKNGRDTPDQ